MDPPNRPVHPTLKKWNCNKTFLLSINIFYLLASIALIIMGVLCHLYLFVSASFLINFGFTYARYSYYLYIFGAGILPLSCVGIAVVFRQSIRLTTFYIRFLSILTTLEIICVIIALGLSPFLKDAIWNNIERTIDQCDITSIAYYAIVHIQMSFSCCGLNQPDMTTGNDTRIQNSCYSKDKYKIYDSYCLPEYYYTINCFESIYNDVQVAVLIILLLAAILIVIQCFTIYSAVMHRRNIRQERDVFDIEFSSSGDAVYSRQERK